MFPNAVTGHCLRCPIAFKMSAYKLQIKHRALGRPLHFPNGFDDTGFKTSLSKYSFLSTIP